MSALAALGPIYTELQKKQKTLWTLTGVMAIGFVVMVLGAVSADNVRRSNAWGTDQKLQTAYNAAIGTVVLGLLGLLSTFAAYLIISGSQLAKVFSQYGGTGKLKFF